MDWLTLLLTNLAALATAVAWPVVLIVALVMFRNQLAKLIGSVETVKYGDLELAFRKQLAEATHQVEQAVPIPREFDSTLQGIEARLIRLVGVSPRTAIQVAWQETERAARHALGQRGWTVNPDPETQRFFDFPGSLKSYKLFDDNQVQAAERIRELRNQVADAPSLVVSADDAAEYVMLALRLIEYLHERAATVATSRTEKGTS